MGGMGILLSRFVAKKRNAVNSTFLPFLTNAADRNRTIPQCRKYRKQEVSAHLSQSVIKSVINLYTESNL